jgi:inner membrane protein
VYRSGHLGVSLLVFAPIGYLLVDAGFPVAAFVTGVAMCWLTMLPDVDHRLPFVSHRGPTHSLLFAVAVGVAFAGVATLGVDALTLFESDLPTVVPFGFFVGFVAVVAHLLGDVLTPAGVPLFWPLSGRRYSVSLTRADNRFANAGLFALGVFAVTVATLLYVR